MATKLENIPPELRAVDRWVCCDRGSKVPQRAFEPGAASVSDPMSWGTWEQAASCVEAGCHQFVGFVLDGDGIVAVDIDGAFDEDGMMTCDAEEAVSALDSYTEVSKSGRGLHVLCLADIPFDGANDGSGFEIYRAKRYIVLTGWVVGPRTALRRAQDAVDRLVGLRFGERRAGGGDGEGRCGPAIWEPAFPRVPRGRIPLQPELPEVTAGSRHMCILSLCGRLWAAGASLDEMLAEARAANERLMRPPLPDGEVEAIAKSTARYRR